MTERLLGAHESAITPSVSELADAREQVGLWREQLDLLKVRVASLTVPRPTARSGGCLRLQWEGDVDSGHCLRISRVPW